MEEFSPIRDFPGYDVSTHGRVFNVRREAEMVLSANAYGELTVGLFRDGKQHRRSVKCLVAREFVPGETHIFNTPILLDGDRTNLHKDNIVWRPRWFAWSYTRQFDQEESWWFAGPVLNIMTEIIYENIIEAAIGTGSLVVDIRRSLMNHTRVFPVGGEFKFI